VDADVVVAGVDVLGDLVEVPPPVAPADDRLTRPLSGDVPTRPSPMRPASRAASSPPEATMIGGSGSGSV